MAERTYRIHVAARLSGVREELIRAWERRYGVPRPERTPSGYRVYTEGDVALLKRLKQLTEEGVSIREAVTLLPGPERAEGEASAAWREAWRDAVLAAAERYDQRRISEVLDEVLSALSPLKAFDEVLAPVQQEVGERWHAGKLTVAQEHLVSQVVRARVVSLLHGAPETEGSRHVVLACFPEEQHEIGLQGVALRLRHMGLRVTLLGQRVPAEELGQLVARVRPAWVGLSAVTDTGATAFEETLARVMTALPSGVPVWLGGPAAERYAEECERGGARVFRAGDEWRKLLQPEVVSRSP